MDSEEIVTDGDANSTTTTTTTIQQYKTTQVFKSAEPFVDMGNLLIEDMEPFDVDEFKSHGNKYLLSVTRDNVQCLFNKIWELPTERVEDAIVVKLPDAISRLPREKPIPKMREKTRWERYALLKGIRNKKKSRMAWDDETKTWKPRWGYQRGNDSTKDWLVEIPRQKDPYKDYYGEKIDRKKEGVAKNELQRLRNIRNQQINRNEFPGIQVESKSSEQLARQINRATSSTASLGKFTERLKDEKRPKNSGKTRKFLPNENTVNSEKTKQFQILQRIQSNSVAPLDVDKAVGNFMQEESSKGSKGTDWRNKPISRGTIRKRSRMSKKAKAQTLKLRKGGSGGGGGKKRNRKTAK